MITNSVDEAGVQAKQEERKNEGVVSSCAVPSSSRRWSSFRNPRIVRVSRFGGKDRHSKVCTVRGLRDRRIRLSVPTAIQIYYLQDKLGLSQPSKVIDWLLEATKEDIDKLPPLQMPLGFGQYHQQMFGDYITGSRDLNDLLLSREPSTSQFSLSPFLPINNSGSTSKHGLKINDAIDGDEADDPARVKSAKYWDINLGLESKKNEMLQRGLLDNEKGNELQKNAGICCAGTHHYAQLSAQNFFPLVGYSSFPSGMTNNTMPYSHNHWEPSNLSLSQFGGFQHQMAKNFQNPNLVSSLPPPPPPSISSAICPLASVSPSLFPTYTPNFAASTENNSRQLNHFQLLSSSLSQPTVPLIQLSLPHSKPFQTDSYTTYFHHQENTRNLDDEEEAN